MYIFTYKNSTEVYAYTNDKMTALDFNDINSEKYRMVRIPKEAVDEGLNLPSGGNILYYRLFDGDGHGYMVPLTESEMNQVMSECNRIYSSFSYINNEVVSNNKYGLKNKYLNIINELTDVLKHKKDNLFGNVLKQKHPVINSLKIYQDMFGNEENNYVN